MKSQRLIILALFILGAAGSVAAQAFTGAKVATINTDMFGDEKKGITKLINAYKALDIEFKPKQDEINNISARIETLAREIRDLQAKLNGPDAKNAQAAIENKTDEANRLQVDLKRKQEDAKAQYEKRAHIVIDPVTTEIGNNIDTYARSRGIDVVLDAGKLAAAGALLMLNPAVDITEAFVKDYNAKSAGVPVKN